MNRLLPLLAVSLVACGRVSAKDAQDFIKTVTAAAETEGEENRFRLLFEGCSEIPSCAHGCEKALSGAASVVASDQGTIVASCFDEYKTAKTNDPSMNVQRWFSGYLKAYAARARDALPESDRGRLDEPLGRIGLR